MSEIAALAQQIKSAGDQPTFKNTWGKALQKEAFFQRNAAKMGPNMKQIINDPKYKETYQKGFAFKAIQNMQQKAAMTMAGVASATPIIFDPEVVDLIATATPFLNSINKYPYQGYTVRLNAISARADPIGAVSESTSQDLSSSTPGGFTIGPVSADMKIFVDLAQTSDFGQMGTSHYMDLRDTNLGERILAHTRMMEQHLLYGNPAKAGAGGDPYDTNSFEGIANICEDQGTNVDKSAVGADYLQDIANELASLMQSGYAINPADLEIWCSYTMLEALKEDIRGSYGRIDVNTNGPLNYGYSGITISGVPVIAGDQIAAHTYAISGPSTESEGDPGDVFIVNKRVAAMYYLAPMSVVPLARIGMADRVGLFEFSTFADRSDGLFCRYLHDYVL